MDAGASLLEATQRLEQDIDSDEEFEENDRDVNLMSASTVTVVSLGVLGFIEYSLVMPSMAKYLERLGAGNGFYGLSLSSFSMAKLLFQPILGTWADRDHLVGPFLFSLLLAMIGNLVYGLAEFLESKWCILIGRSLVGMGAANSTLVMSYISRITTKHNRTKALAIINGLNLLGIVLGPVTNILINFTVDTGIKGLQLNPYTNPGFFMAIFLVVMCFMMTATFREPKRAYGLLENNENFLITRRETEDSTSLLSTGEIEGWSPVYRRIFFRDKLWVHYVLSFVSNFILAELETALPVLTFDSYGWGTVENALLYAVVGIITAFTLIFTGVFSHRISDREFVSAGTVIYGVALIFCCLTLSVRRPSYVAFCFCLVCLIIASPLVDSPNVAFYSKRISENGESARFLGLFLSFLDGFTGISRILGPLYAGFALASPDRLVVYLGPTILWAFMALVYVSNFNEFKETEKIRMARSVRRFTSSPAIIQSPLLSHITLPEEDE